MNDIWSLLARYIVPMVCGGLGGAILTWRLQARQKAAAKKSLLKRLKVDTQANLRIVSDNKTNAEYRGLGITSKLLGDASSGKIKELPLGIFTPLDTATYEYARKEEYGFPEELMEPIHHYVPLATRLNYLMQLVDLDPYRMKQDRALFIRLCEEMIAVLESTDNELDALLR